MTKSYIDDTAEYHAQGKAYNDWLCHATASEIALCTQFRVELTKQLFDKRPDGLHGLPLSNVHVIVPKNFIDYFELFMPIIGFDYVPSHPHHDYYTFIVNPKFVFVAEY